MRSRSSSRKEAKKVWKKKKSKYSFETGKTKIRREAKKRIKEIKETRKESQEENSCRREQKKKQTERRRNDRHEEGRVRIMNKGQRRPEKKW